jgi:hypothetical protein
MRLTEQLLAAVAAYMEATGWSERRLSLEIYGARRCGPFTRLRQGKDMLSGNVETGLRWLSTNWPDATPWPDGVMRPEPVDELRRVPAEA